LEVLEERHGVVARIIAVLFSNHHDATADVDDDDDDGSEGGRVSFSRPPSDLLLYEDQPSENVAVVQIHPSRNHFQL
jgi:hypothetical protein